MDGKHDASVYLASLTAVPRFSVLVWCPALCFFTLFPVTGQLAHVLTICLRRPVGVFLRAPTGLIN
jgi:hypothetical protein